MVKSVTKEVPASDSESEQPRSAKKSASAVKNASNNKGHTEEGVAASGSGSGDEDEEEYEIEIILDARPGAFEGERVGYLVKWKGYDEEHNSWVDEKDAEGARELIDEYWRKHGKKTGGRKSDVKPKPAAKPRKSAVKDDEEEEVPPAKKRGRPPKAQARPSEEQDEDVEMEDVPKKKPRKSTGRGGKRGAATTEDQDEEEYTDMKKWKELSTWEHLVESIDTVERTDNNELLVYFTLKNGKGHGRETSDVCKHKIPFKLIEFYESNLRWKPTDENAMQE
ncbi:hypothetical protein V8D89_011637 [Ganoderma adspersum]